ncbi:UNVERIFIED_ORG: opacity protein-like surface antigen [Variovorax paradoxus]|nr:opacity protein-like surface antigen [Variovorax paradoxus]
MNPMIRLLLAATLLWSWLGPAAAQEVVEASDMVRGGMQAIEMIDQGKAGELWDGAAPATRKRVTRADFVGQVARSRAQIGVPQMRTWVSVNRQVVAAQDGDTAGQYVSIEYETRFTSKSDGTVRELVSFHLDQDRVWRFSGYALK